MYSFLGGLQEKGTLYEVEEVEHWPGVVATSVGTRQEALASNDGLGQVPGQFGIAEAPEAQYLVDDESRGYFAVID